MSLPHRMEPLLSRIKEKRNALLVPIIDRISDLTLDYGYSYKYFKVGRDRSEVNSACHGPLNESIFKPLIIEPYKQTSKGSSTENCVLIDISRLLSVPFSYV